MSPENDGIVETISMDIQPQANVIWEGLADTLALRAVWKFMQDK